MHIKAQLRRRGVRDLVPGGRIQHAGRGLGARFASQ